MGWLSEHNYEVGHKADFDAAFDDPSPVIFGGGKLVVLVSWRFHNFSNSLVKLLGTDAAEAFIPHLATSPLFLSSPEG